MCGEVLCQHFHGGAGVGTERGRGENERKVIFCFCIILMYRLKIIFFIDNYTRKYYDSIHINYCVKCRFYAII